MSAMLTTANFVPPSKNAVLCGKSCRIELFVPATHGKELWEEIKDFPDLFYWIPSGPYSSLEEFQEFTAKAQNVPVPICVRYAIIDLERNTTVGMFSLLDIRSAVGVGEVGYIVFSPAMQRSYIGTEAMYLLASYFFDTCNFRRYEWKCDAKNVPSNSAAVRYGFTFEGIFRQHMVVKGRNRDTAWYSIIDSEWALVKLAYEAWLSEDNHTFAASSIRGEQKESLGHFMKLNRCTVDTSNGSKLI